MNDSCAGILRQILGSNMSIDVLDLSDCDVGDTTVRAIADAIENGHPLSETNFEGNLRISDEVWSFIIYFPC